MDSAAPRNLDLDGQGASRACSGEARRTEQHARGSDCDEEGVALVKDGRSFVGVPCTLDGKPAEIMGRRNDFATVAQIPQGVAVEFSWQAVARIMQGSKEFKS